MDDNNAHLKVPASLDVLFAHSVLRRRLDNIFGIALQEFWPRQEPQEPETDNLQN